MTDLAISVPSDVVQAIAERVAAMLELSSKSADGTRWPEWMSVETAARYLDVSPERVRKLQARGHLPYYQEGPGCRVFFNRRELEQQMAKFRVP
jgi:excisionase family DNA binding protein